MGELLYRKQICCGIADVKDANCVWDSCCKGRNFFVGLLLYREQIGCGSAAVQGANCLWNCCSKLSKMCWSVLYKEQIGCGIAAVKGAKCVGVLLNREQIGCGIAAVKEQNVWECCCTGSNLVVGLLL